MVSATETVIVTVLRRSRGLPGLRSRRPVMGAAIVAADGAARPAGIGREEPVAAASVALTSLPAAVIAAARSGSAVSAPVLPRPTRVVGTPSAGSPPVDAATATAAVRTAAAAIEEAVGRARGSGVRRSAALMLAMARAPREGAAADSSGDLVLVGVAMIHVVAAALAAPHLHEHHRHHRAQRGTGEFRYLVARIAHVVRRPLLVGLLPARPDAGVAPVVAVVVGGVAIHLVVQLGRAYRLGVVQVLVRLLARTGPLRIVGTADVAAIVLLRVAAHPAPLFMALPAHQASGGGDVPCA